MQNSQDPVENNSAPNTNESVEAIGPTKQGKSKAPLFIGLGVLAVAVIGVASFQVLTAPTPLEQVVDECGLSGKVAKGTEGIALDEDGKGLYLDGMGKESRGLITEEISCVLFGLDVPQSVVSRMDNTNSIMGQQEATWDNIRALWTYHPNSGFDVSLEIE
jgi:hypothetical protein